MSNHLAGRNTMPKFSYTREYIGNIAGLCQINERGYTAAPRAITADPLFAQQIVDALNEAHDRRLSDGSLNGERLNGDSLSDSARQVAYMQTTGGRDIVASARADSALLKDLY